MRGKTIWGAWLLAGCLALAPSQVRADGDAAGYAPPDPVLWHPLGSTRPEDGGLFVYGDYVMYRQTNPIKEQQVAVRGFIATNDSFPGVPTGATGFFIGSREEALNTRQVSGPSTYQPGFEVGTGWKFKDGSALTFSWMYLTKAQYRAAATLAKPGFTFRPDFADSYLTSYVYNFPPQFAGPPNKIDPATGADAMLAYGIWNGASVMTEEFVQRTQQFEMTYRIPVYDTECYRLSGLMGARFFWIWERFKWRTTSLSFDGGGGAPEDNGVYTNIVSNRMYGPKIGISQEWYLGHGFACTLDLQTAMFLDVVKERAKYETDAKYIGPENKRARTDYKFVPEFQATLGVMWYPTEAIQLYFAWDAFCFLNTISSPRPIDFNYSALAPPWENTFRFFDGLKAGIALQF